MSNELYEILGVPLSASLEEIHAAFRKKAREHHPDLGGDRKKFQQLNDAYEQLLKTKEAQRYQSDLKQPSSEQSSTRQPMNQPGHAEAPSSPYQSPLHTESRPRRKRKQHSATSSSIRQLLTGKLPLQDQTTFFILVNALDIFLTYLHLRSGNIEANPIANFFIKQWNVTGMIIFKLSIVAAVCVIAQVVALSSLRKASRLLNFGTAVIGCIVAYSIYLLAK